MLHVVWMIRLCVIFIYSTFFPTMIIALLKYICTYICMYVCVYLLVCLLVDLQRWLQTCFALTSAIIYEATNHFRWQIKNTKYKYCMRLRLLLLLMMLLLVVHATQNYGCDLATDAPTFGIINFLLLLLYLCFSHSHYDSLIWSALRRMRLNIQRKGIAYVCVCIWMLVWFLLNMIIQMGLHVIFRQITIPYIR